MERKWINQSMNQSTYFPNCRCLYFRIAGPCSLRHTCKRERNHVNSSIYRIWLWWDGWKDGGWNGVEGAHQKSVTVPMIIDDETFISDRFGVGGGGGLRRHWRWKRTSLTGAEWRWGECGEYLLANKFSNSFIIFTRPAVEAERVDRTR